jgi:hypothetical protein
MCFCCTEIEFFQSENEVEDEQCDNSEHGSSDANQLQPGGVSSVTRNGADKSKCGSTGDSTDGAVCVSKKRQKKLASEGAESEKTKRTRKVPEKNGESGEDRD